MSQDAANEFLMGGGGKSAKFETVGASITGTIASPPEVRQQTHIKTGDPLTWENGDPKMQLVVVLQTALKEDEDDDGRRAIYVKGSKDPASQSMHSAVREAVKASGAPGLEVGATMTVTYIGDGVSSGAGMNPPKKYTATYARPVVSMDAAAPAAAPAVAAPVAAPPAAQPAAAATPAPAAASAAAAPVVDVAAQIESAKTLIAAGQPDTVIVPATGIDPSVLAALRNA